MYAPSTHTHTHTRIHIHTHSDTHTQIHTDTHSDTHTHAHAHARTHTHAHAHKRFQVRYESLNLGKLQWLVDCGRIDTSKPINMLTLQKAGAVGRIKHGIKLLGDVRICYTVLTTAFENCPDILKL